jgi:hypothetical protein
MLDWKRLRLGAAAVVPMLLMAGTTTTVSAATRDAGAVNMTGSLVWGATTAPAVQPSGCQPNLAGRVALDFVGTIAVPPDGNTPPPVSATYAGAFHLDADMALTPGWCNDALHGEYTLSNIVMTPGPSAVGTLSCGFSAPGDYASLGYSGGLLIFGMVATCSLNGAPPVALGFAGWGDFVPTAADTSGHITGATVSELVFVTAR